MRLIWRVILAKELLLLIQLFLHCREEGWLALAVQLSLLSTDKSGGDWQEGQSKRFVEQVSVEKMSQLLSGIFCKQRKFKTAPSCLKVFLPNAYSQLDSTEEGCTRQFSFFSWVILLCNWSCPAFCVVQHTLLMLRVLHGRSRMDGRTFYKEIQTSYL